MRNRMTRTLPWAASVVVLTIAASAAVQTGHAQTTATTTAAQPKAQAKADECLARPGAAAPKGSHWYYRIERPSKRRCWYIGPMKARTAAAADRTETTSAERPAARPARRAVPMPTAAPSELRPDEQMRAGTPAATETTEGRTPAPVASNTDALNFPAWPMAAAGGPYVPATAAAPVNDAAPATDEAEAAVAETAAEGMPLVWPVMSAAERAAAAQQPAGPSPGLLHVVIFVAATIAFAAIAITAVLKLTASRRVKPDRWEPVRVAEPVIRRREPGRFATPEPSIEAMSEPAIARLREVAKRWDTPARVARQPRLAAYEMEPDYEVRVSPPRRRAVA